MGTAFPVVTCSDAWERRLARPPYTSTVLHWAIMVHGTMERACQERITPLSRHRRDVMCTPLPVIYAG